MFLGQSLSVFNAFIMHKNFTFLSNEKGLKSFKEFLRFNVIYLFCFMFNLILLPILVEILLFDAFYAGISSILIITVISYSGHQYYTFSNNDKGD